MLKMKVAVKGNKALGQNPRKVIGRAVFTGTTEKQIRDAFIKWRDENGYTARQISDKDITDESGAPVCWLGEDGEIRRLGNGVSVNEVENGQ